MVRWPGREVKNRQFRNGLLTAFRYLSKWSNSVFRTRAVKHLLLEDIAGIPQGGRDHRGDPKPPEFDDSKKLLERARRRALLVVAMDWIALLVLVYARTQGGQLLDIGPSEDTIFSLGLLAIATHSGFRLGQLEKLNTVGRALDDLSKRSHAAAGGAESR